MDSAKLQSSVRYWLRHKARYPEDTEWLEAMLTELGATAWPYYSKEELKQWAAQRAI